MARSASPSSSNSPVRTTRLFIRTLNASNPIARRRSWITSAVSTSAAGERVPMVSKSHCMNSR